MRYDERVESKGEKEMNNLTAKEQETVKTLVRLGDSLELAIKTVINERKKQDNSEFYYKAYCL